MIKYFFYNDYSEGAHPSILEKLSSTNLEQQIGYGGDEYAEKAKAAMQNHLKNTDADIHFISGGTQTNLIALGSMLRPYESVIAAETGHISVHEAGAIEATGHKINTVKTVDGKLSAESINAVVRAHTDEHMVKPKAVFISNATELGTVYKKAELKEVADYCHKNNLYLYLDGARLGAALTSGDSDLNLHDLCEYADLFYIGGTKNGALLGEALVIVNQDLKENFRYHLKQKGALLAKGRILALQFLALFTDNLFFELAKHGNRMAEQLAKGIKDMGYGFLVPSSTNQIFPIFPDAIIKELQKDYGFYVWQKKEQGVSAIRLVTSWATREESVSGFLEDLKKLRS